jgi:hypothetical protein
MQVEAEIATLELRLVFFKSFSYYNLMDLFGNVPLQQRMILWVFSILKQEQKFFAFVESELQI